MRAPNGCVVDLFCGAGGLSHGFKLERFRISAGFDSDPNCRYPYEANNAAEFRLGDVARLRAAEVRRLYPSGLIRILVGCAPCQPFSTYNQKNTDPKWKLLAAFSRLIRVVRPELVSMENVPRLARFRSGTTFAAFRRNLERCGYHVAWGVLYAPDFGLAQKRRRLVLLASRLGPILLPCPTRQQPYRTVADEIAHLPAVEQGGADPADRLHRASGLSPTNQTRIGAARPGATWREWGDESLVAKCHRTAAGRSYAAVYGRMRWDEPAPTITTEFYGFGNGRFGHPEQDRALTLREGALLQGFSAAYRFVPPCCRVHFKTVGRMIGNAVPVPLAQAIAREMRLHIEKFA